MRRTLSGCAVLAAIVYLGGCSSDPGTEEQALVVGTGAAPARRDDAGAADAARPMTDAAVHEGASDARADAKDPNWCQWGGAPGECMTTSACAAIADHASFAGECPGQPASIQCCIDAPDVSDNPPVPMGWTLMQQANVTAAMTTWAVDILHDPITYPMWSSTTMDFTVPDGGMLLVLARVEWHPPDFQNSAIHRGVTLYQPI